MAGRVLVDGHSGRTHVAVEVSPSDGRRRGIDPGRPPPAYGSMPASTISGVAWMPWSRSSSAAARVIARTERARRPEPAAGIARRDEPPVKARHRRDFQGGFVWVAAAAARLRPFRRRRRRLPGTPIRGSAASGMGTAPAGPTSSHRSAGRCGTGQPSALATAACIGSRRVVPPRQTAVS